MISMKNHLTKKNLALMILFVATAHVWGGADSLSGSFASTLNNASSLFGSSKTESISGQIPEGKELFPILYRLLNDEHKISGKTVALETKFKNANAINDEYKISYKVYFKFGIGLQCRESEIIVKKGDGDSFTVETPYYVSYNVDKNLQRTSDPLTQGKSAMTQNSKNFVADVESFFANTNDDDYNTWYEKAYSDLEIQLDVGNYAVNRLKAKRWYEKHSLEGKTVEFPLYLVSLDESKTQGFEYILGGLKGKVIIQVLSNNDNYLDAKENTVIPIKGKVIKVSYSEEAPDYKIKAILIEETE